MDEQFVKAAFASAGHAVVNVKIIINKITGYGDFHVDSSVLARSVYLYKTSIRPIWAIQLVQYSSYLAYVRI